MSKTSSNYCWIRETKSDGSSHRVGCIAMKKVNATAVKVAFSLCAPCDAESLDLTKAKRLALRRLNEFATSAKTAKISDLRNSVDWAAAIGVAITVMKHTKQGRTYDWSRNNSSFMGLLSEIDPQARKA